MSQERPQNNANRERLREEAPTAPQVLDIEGPSFLPPPGEGNPFALTPNHNCRLFNYPIQDSPPHAIIPHIPQVAQSTTPQHSTHLTVQPDLPTPREEPPIVRPDIEGLRFPPEVRSGTPRATTSHSASDTRVPTPNVPEPDTLSSDSTDSLMAQLRQVNRRLDEVQKEFVKSKEALGESSKGGSPFAPEIQDKPIPPSF
ncbi:hypothetical protein BHM03_00024709 [Ensete ventricosum]|nr:hypothetical protein BHM03_00024709 [Ensete ventricosum]